MQQINKNIHSKRLGRTVAVFVLVLIASLMPVTSVCAATPPAPTNLTAEVLPGGQIKLSWVDNSIYETGFSVERATSNIDEVFVSNRIFFTVPTNDVNFTDNTVAPATTYYYRVSAVGNEGNSAPSGTVTATTPVKLTFPEAPLDLMARPELSSGVLLRWKDQSDNEEGFRIERAADALFVSEVKDFNVDAGAVFFIDSTVQGHTLYYYKVVAWNSDGDSPSSNTVSLTTLNEVPEAPTDLVVEFIDNRQVKLRWIDNSESEDGFQVERATDADFEHDLAIFNVEANFTARVSLTAIDHQTPAGLFFYRVKAYNASGSSAYSNVCNITVNDYPTQDILLFGNDTAPMNFTGFTLIAPVSVSINRFAQSQEGSITLSSIDDKARLQIPAGTRMFNVNGNPLTQINYFVPDVFPHTPDDKTIIGAFDFGPNGATFSNKATLTLKYDPADFPRDVTYSDLSVSCWNGSDWKTMSDLKFTPAANTLTVSMMHAGLVAIIGPKPDLSAKFTVSNLYVLPQSALVGETVYISLTVTNIGHSFGYYDVVLMLNGEAEDTKQVSLEPGQKADVQYTCYNKPVGEYKIDINGTRASFSIQQPVINSPSPTPTITPSVNPTYSPVTVEPEEPAQFPYLVVIMAAALAIILIIVFILLRR
jgi:hypothetical protein